MRTTEQWSLAAWQHLSSTKGKLATLNGWHRCVKNYCDVDSEEDRKAALTASTKGEFKVFEVPEKEESAPQATDVWEGAPDDSDDELDVSKPRSFGERRSKRKRSEGQRQIGSYMIDSSQIELSDDD